MSQDNGQTAIGTDPNLYDYWKMIVRRRKLVASIFLLAVAIGAAIGTLSPRIYRGEAVLEIAAGKIGSGITGSKILSAEDMVALLGRVDKQKIEAIFPEHAVAIANVRLSAVKEEEGGNEIFTATIESRDPSAMPGAFNELVSYLNSLPVMSESVNQLKARLTKQSEELASVIGRSKGLESDYRKLLGEGKLIPVGFNPIELESKISDLKIQKMIVDQDIRNLTGVRTLQEPFVSRRPVRPRVALDLFVAGLVGLFAGITLALFVEGAKGRS